MTTSDESTEGSKQHFLAVPGSVAMIKAELLQKVLQEKRLKKK